MAVCVSDARPFAQSGERPWHMWEFMEGRATLLGAVVTGRPGSVNARAGPRHRYGPGEKA
jgi:hypothetical protein